MLKLYNSLSRRKEDFVPLDPPRVSMYLCGPTVYDLLHVGNFRGVIVFNMLRAWLEHKGYDVRFIYNYTDVDDKIIQRAAADGRLASEVAETYIREFEKDFAALKLKPHSRNPRVTEFMTAIIDFISELISKGAAYERAGDVYFATDQFPQYGKLSGKNRDELKAGIRVEVNEAKLHPADFALWKAAKPGEPKWSSPWGEGRPGWHIECSAMAMELLGPSIDIHGGGSDLIFPHHENEIAQSEARTGQNFARCWVHNNMLTFGDQKMSKSLGNIRTGRWFIENYTAELLKFLMLSVHYRSPLDFSEDSIHQSLTNLAGFYASLQRAVEVKASASEKGSTELVPLPEEFAAALEASEARLREAFDDDLNTPEVMAELHKLKTLFNQLLDKAKTKMSAVEANMADTYLALFRRVGQFMSLFAEEPLAYLERLNDVMLRIKSLSREEIDALVRQRSEARSQRDFKEADRLRDELTAKGIQLMDGTQGTRWSAF